MSYSEGKENAEQIRRITEMENRFNRADGALHTLSSALDPFQSVLEDIRALSKYYEGPLWREDFESDEAGLLPAGLRRGVLSEDGIYDLLTEYDALIRRLSEFVHRG